MDRLPGRAPSAALAVSAALCALYCVYAAASVWPAIDGDGPAYFPAAVEWSRHHSLSNPVWLPPLNDTIDGPGGRRYVYHGFLYQLVVGTAGRFFGAAPQGAVRAAYALHWIVALVSSLAILSWSRVSGGWGVLMAGLLPLSMLGLTVAWHGRMEPLALLLVAAACLSWRVLPSPWREASAGAAIPLLGFTSPACGPLAGLMLIAAFAASRGAGLLRGAIAALLAAVVATMGVLAWYPYSLMDWAGGVSRHSRINLSLASWQGFTPTWVTRPELPLLVITFGILAAAAVVWTMRQCRTFDVRTVVLGASALLFAAAVWRLAFVKSEASYNAVVWIPLIASVAVANRPAPWVPGLMVLALALPAAGLTRSSLLLATARRETPAFEALQSRVAHAPSQGVAISSGLWLAADAPSRITITGVETPAADTFIVQQAYTGRSAPPQFAGYRLTENHFGPGVTVFGVPISRTSAGWAYAVYERDHGTARID